MLAAVPNAAIDPSGLRASAIGAAGPGALLFQAAIVPHRSLSPRGLKMLLALLALLSCYTMTLLWLIGAWPVMGFSGIEVGLAIVLVRAHGRGTRASELVLLTDRELRVVRTDPKGRRRECVLPPAWLRVRLEQRQGRAPALLLLARGMREEIGASLGEEQKRELASSLAAALDRLRNPRFDNPQLRD